MTTRKTREVRRDEVLDAALEEFAELGLHRASTEDIARRAGISQP
jgi:AcrR family transcriptional regulator